MGATDEFYFRQFDCDALAVERQGAKHTRLGASGAGFNDRMRDRPDPQSVGAQGRHRHRQSIEKGAVTQADASQFIALLRQLDIEPDAQTHDQALGDMLSLANQYGLSSYDAAYLELALRKGIPLATVDKALGDAASKAGWLRVFIN